MKTDFGPGFYTTTSYDQALLRAGGDPAGVVAFRVSSSDLAGLSGRTFASADKDFVSFTRGIRGGDMHSFDYVSGPYIRNPATFYKGADPVVTGDQTSFHTAAGVRVLGKAFR